MINFKKGDIIYIRYSCQKIFHKSEVVGFTAMGMVVNPLMKWIVPFARVFIFYGAGYSGNVRAITVIKIWHYYPAVICEKIRLALPQKLARRLGLEN